MDLIKLFLNPYELLFLISLVSNLILIIFILRRVYSSVVILAYLFYLSGTLVMGVGQMMAGISYRPELFEFWNSWFIVGILYYPPTILLFTLAFLGKEEALKNFLFWMLIIIPLALFMNIALRGGDLLIINDFSKAKLYAWGYQVFATGKLSVLVTLWYQFCFIPSFVMLINFYRKTRDKLIKKQALLLIGAVIIPYIGGVLTQGVLPQFGIRIFPVGIPLNTINIILIAYALVKYGSTTIDPFAIASSIVKTMHSAVIVINSQNNIILVNRFARDFLGYKEDALIGENIGKILPEGYLHAESEVVTSSGEKISVNIYPADYKDKFSGYNATILTLADVQTLKKLQRELEEEKMGVEQKVVERTLELKEEHAKLVASVNSLSVGFILVDRTLNIFTMNSTAGQILFSKKPSEITFDTISNRFPQTVDLKNAVKKCIDTNKKTDFKEVVFGEYFLRIILSPISLAKEIIGCAILIEDISEEKIIERSRDEFLSLASHELRSPLTAIRDYTVVMEESPVIKNNTELKKATSVINESVLRLISIVNDFIDIYALEQKEMIFKKEAVDMGPLIQEVLNEFMASAKEKKLYLKLENTGKIPLIEGDPDRIKQIIANLVSNSIKYTEQGGLSIKTVREDKYLKILISDTGMGIKPNLQKFLFRKFQQAVDNIYTRGGIQKGTGLGLYIAKLLVNHMGGQIGLESSTIDKGSTFYFTLPYAKHTA